MHRNSKIFLRRNQMTFASIPNSSYDILIREKLRKQNQETLQTFEQSAPQEKQVKTKSS